MKVLLVGGGSGGHITPPLAVAHELKKHNSKIAVEYIIEKGSRFKHVPENSKDIDVVHSVFAGKLRRYHGESILSHILDIKTNIKNIIDGILLFVGLIQALYLVKKISPDAVFIKGGFVGVPIGIACAFWKIPYFTHDSDTVPGLANRIISRWSRLHAVGMPPEFYNYPKDKTVYVGIPISSEFKKVTPGLKKEYRKTLDLSPDDPVLCITGGSLGAVRLNNALLDIAPILIDKLPNLQILHQTGSNQKELYGGVNPDIASHVIEFSHVTDIYRYIGSADVVVTRAGATTIAELALQEKACVVVPNPQLTGGQQSKNAKHIGDMGAVVVVSETQMLNKKYFADIIIDLFQSEKKRSELGEAISKLANPESSKQIANIILEIASNEGKS